MTTFTAVGPAQDIDGPLPVKPKYGLLSVPGVLVDNADEHWLNGVNVFGYPANLPLTWEPCSTGTNRSKSEESNQPLARFDSFGIYLPVTCSVRGDADIFAGRAELALEATQSFAVEQAFSQGVQFSSNPFFGDVNVSVLAGGTAVSPEVGISYLENAIGGTGRRGLIHADPASVAGLGFNFLRQIDPDGVEDNGDEYIVTTSGTPVVSGGGYIGATANGAAAGAGNSWAFATGPVQVRVSDAVITDLAQSIDRSLNDLVFRAEKYVLAVWDTAAQFAVKIDWTP